MCLKKLRTASTGNMDELKKKLTRSLSGPKRCSYCQKMVYFSIAKCKECGDVTHKHCDQHSNLHGNPVAKNTSEDVCNSVNTDSALWCSMHHRDKETGKNRTFSDSSYDYDDTRQGALNHTSSVAMTGLLKIVRWLSQRKKTKELYCKSNPATIEKHVKGRFGLNPKLEDKEAKKKLKALLKTTQTYQRQLYGHSQPQQQQSKQLPFQKQRCSSARSAPSATSHRCQRRLCRSFAIRSSDSNEPSPRSSVSSYNEFASPFSTPRSNRGDNYKENNQAGGNNESTYYRCHNREQKNVPDPFSGGTAFTERQDAGHQTLTSTVLLPESSGWTFGESKPCRLLCDPRRKNADHAGPRAPNVQRFGKRPCIGKAKTLSIESRDCNTESLCATWPPVGKAGTIAEEGSGDEDEEGLEAQEVSDTFSVDCHRGEENIQEWCIPYGDLEFQDKIKNGRHGDIFKGRWYGEVLIYTIRHSCNTELRQFLEDVSQMGMIRHENIVLFMGACIDPPNLAVITSMRKGPTLYEYLHLKRNRLPFHSKLNIARQIAQGMGYLHAKGITHKKLNSKNIILESRVKLCMMDYGMADKKLDRPNCGCISRGQLSYLSPELMKSLRIEPPRIFPTCPFTQQTDIFAFGSLLYELLAERFALHDQHPHAVIWKVATGKRSSLESFRFVSGLKSLIRKCWSQNATNRPPFSEVVNILQENVTHHKRHSSSVPDKLQYTGNSLRRNICT